MHLHECSIVASSFNFAMAFMKMLTKLGRPAPALQALFEMEDVLCHDGVHVHEKAVAKLKDALVLDIGDMPGPFFIISDSCLLVWDEELKKLNIEGAL